RATPTQLFEHVQAALAGHEQVEENEIYPSCVYDLERAAAVGGQHDVVIVFEDQLQSAPDAGFVVDDEDHRAGRARCRHRGGIVASPRGDLLQHGFDVHGRLVQ